ncbi:DUF116 domain-containing protein [Desulfohalovibrio reitneri]|uniref:DUF116 domain-containing protein n=1 Tax=Desulfohalovibrio reitneri TaxID=1307759 RepID=UPI00068EB739|nr:DUF116 domain-containing protein [Desulfohalovibrio reitneri]
MTNDLNDEIADELAQPARKRLFIGLITGSSLLLCLALALLFAVPYIGLRDIHPLAPWITGGVLLLVMLAVLGAALGLVYNILTGRSLPLFHRVRGVTVKLFLPLMTLLGKALGFSKRQIRASFIKVNNELVEHQAGTYPPDKVLVLLPHCLQRSDCGIRLTHDMSKCKRCGRCPIHGLISLAEKYGLHIAIATGGTIARRIVVQTRPKIILAVACERDLASGIQDTYPLPVFGVLNERPFGPCLDTQVALPALEAAARRFLTPQAVAEADERERLAREEAEKKAREKAEKKEKDEALGAS